MACSSNYQQLGYLCRLQVTTSGTEFSPVVVPAIYFRITLKLHELMLIVNISLGTITKFFDMKAVIMKVFKYFRMCSAKAVQHTAKWYTYCLKLHGNYQSNSQFTLF